MNTCGTCGYADTDHTGKDRRCPICACGATPAAHLPVFVRTKDGVTVGRGCLCDCGVAPFMHGTACDLCAERLPHACRYATMVGLLCTGRRSEATGDWLVVRQGSFKTPPEPETALWPQVLARDVAARHAAADAARAPWEPEHVSPPRIVARAPRDLTEVAAGQGRQARGLGRKAVAAGWSALAYYWMAGDGTEGSAVKMMNGQRRAVAVWERAPGAKGWKASTAYAWTVGAGLVPAPVTITQLERFLNE